LRAMHTVFMGVLSWKKGVPARAIAFIMSG